MDGISNRRFHPDCRLSCKIAAMTSVGSRPYDEGIRAVAAENEPVLF
jgi:hypothetical protein